MWELNAHSGWQKTKLQIGDAEQQIYLCDVWYFEHHTVIYNFSQILVGKCAHLSHTMG